MSRRRCLALGVAVLAGCSFAPHYQRPDSGAARAAFKEAGGWMQAAPADSQARGAWWSMFHDNRLSDLQDQLGRSNQDLKAAFASLQQARAAVRVARADYYPTVTAGPSLTRTRTSQNSPHYSAAFPEIYNDYLLQADVSYEIDVWGRVRNAVASAKAGAQASAADLASLELAQRAELATDYFSLRGDDALQLLLERTEVDYAKALQLTQNLYNGGDAALTDVAQAQAQLETARTQTEEIRLQRAQLEHAIAVLVGAPASSFHLDPQPLAATPPPPLDPGLPSALLQRRPDVAAAERRAAAANAQIGVARAAYFPVFSLSGGIGFEGTSGSNWIEAPSRFWTLGPSALLTIFNGGRYDALTDQARAAYDEAAANYRGSVLTAYQEVEDNLAALRQLERESISQAAAVSATRKELEQANYRYKGGVATYLEVVTAENAALQAQQSQVDIQMRRMSASVLLVKALGGGWNADLLGQAQARPADAPARTAAAD